MSHDPENRGLNARGIGCARASNVPPQTPSEVPVPQPPQPPAPPQPPGQPEPRPIEEPPWETPKSPPSEIPVVDPPPEPTPPPPRARATGGRLNAHRRSDARCKRRNKSDQFSAIQPEPNLRGENAGGRTQRCAHALP